MENAALCFVPESVLDVALGAGCSTVGVAGLGSRVHGSARCGTVWHGAASGRLPSLAVCTVWHLARCGTSVSRSLAYPPPCRRASASLSSASDLPMPLNALVAATAAALRHAAIGRHLLAAITALSLASLVLNAATTTALTWETT